MAAGGNAAAAAAAPWRGEGLSGYPRGPPLPLFAPAHAPAARALTRRASPFAKPHTRHFLRGRRGVSLRNRSGAPRWRDAGVFSRNPQGPPARGALRRLRETGCRAQPCSRPVLFSRNRVPGTAVHAPRAVFAEPGSRSGVSGWHETCIRETDDPLLPGPTVLAFFAKPCLGPVGDIAGYLYWRVCPAWSFAKPGQAVPPSHHPRHPAHVSSEPGAVRGQAQATCGASRNRRLCRAPERRVALVFRETRRSCLVRAAWRWLPSLRENTQGPGRGRIPAAGGGVLACGATGAGGRGPVWAVGVTPGRGRR
jgi:hypothetical protein